MKVFIALMLAAVLAALGGAGLFMLKKGGDPGSRDRRMARALALRVALSVLLFLLVLLSWRLGWIRPTGIPTGP